MSSFWFKALCIAINFLVFWSICWSCNLLSILLRCGTRPYERGTQWDSGPFVEVLSSISTMVPSILQDGQFRCLFFWWDSCYKVWLQKVFSIFWVTLFWFFLSSPLVLWCPLPIFPNTCMFPFIRAFRLFLHLVVLFLPLFIFYRFSLIAWHIFLCQIPSYILSVFYYCLY